MGKSNVHRSNICVQTVAPVFLSSATIVPVLPPGVHITRFPSTKGECKVLSFGCSRHIKCGTHNGRPRINANNRRLHIGVHTTAPASCSISPNSDSYLSRPRRYSQHAIATNCQAALLTFRFLC